MFSYLTPSKVQNMYRIILFASTILLFSSCVKKGNYTCNCSSNNVLIQRETYNDINKKHAEDKCDDLQLYYTNSDTSHTTPSVTCILN